MRTWSTATRRQCFECFLGVPKGARFRLVTDDRTVNQQVESVPWLQLNLGQASSFFGGRQLLRNPRPFTGFSEITDADGREGRRGFHHGYLGMAVFAATCPPGGAGCYPTLPVHGRYGGARGTGGGGICKGWMGGIVISTGSSIRP